MDNTLKEEVSEETKVSNATMSSESMQTEKIWCDEDKKVARQCKEDIPKNINADIQSFNQGEFSDSKQTSVFDAESNDILVMDNLKETEAYNINRSETMSQVYNSCAYKIPTEMFPEDLLNNLNTGLEIDNKMKRELVNVIYKDVIQQTRNPEAGEYAAILKALFDKWPYLKIVEGLTINQAKKFWKKRLRAKFNGNRNRKKSTHKFEILNEQNAVKATFPQMFDEKTEACVSPSPHESYSNSMVSSIPESNLKNDDLQLKNEQNDDMQLKNEQNDDLQLKNEQNDDLQLKNGQNDDLQLKNEQNDDLQVKNEQNDSEDNFFKAVTNLKDDVIDNETVVSSSGHNIYEPQVSINECQSGCSSLDQIINSMDGNHLPSSLFEVFNEKKPLKVAQETEIVDFIYSYISKNAAISNAYEPSAIVYALLNRWPHLKILQGLSEKEAENWWIFNMEIKFRCLQHQNSSSTSSPDDENNCKDKQLKDAKENGPLKTTESCCESNVHKDVIPPKNNSFGEEIEKIKTGNDTAIHPTTESDSICEFPIIDLTNDEIQKFSPIHNSPVNHLGNESDDSTISSKSIMEELTNVSTDVMKSRDIEGTQHVDNPSLESTVSSHIMDNSSVLKSHDTSNKINSTGELSHLSDTECLSPLDESYNKINQQDDESINIKDCVVKLSPVLDFVLPGTGINKRKFLSLEDPTNGSSSQKRKLDRTYQLQDTKHQKRRISPRKKSTEEISPEPQNIHNNHEIIQESNDILHSKCKQKSVNEKDLDTQANYAENEIINDLGTTKLKISSIEGAIEDDILPDSQNVFNKELHQGLNNADNAEPKIKSVYENHVAVISSVTEQSSENNVAKMTPIIEDSTEPITPGIATSNPVKSDGSLKPHDEHNKEGMNKPTGEWLMRPASVRIAPLINPVIELTPPTETHPFYEDCTSGDSILRYSIPISKFPSALLNKLNERTPLNVRQEKRLLSILHAHVSQYILYPESHQYLAMVQEILRKWPHLKVSCGLIMKEAEKTWKKRLRAKFRQGTIILRENGHVEYLDKKRQRKRCSPYDGSKSNNSKSKAAGSCSDESESEKEDIMAIKFFNSKDSTSVSLKPLKKHKKSPSVSHQVRAKKPVEVISSEQVSANQSENACALKIKLRNQIFHLPLDKFPKTLYENLNRQQSLDKQDEKAILKVIHSCVTKHILFPNGQDFHAILGALLSRWPHLKEINGMTKKKAWSHWKKRLRSTFGKYFGRNSKKQLIACERRLSGSDDSVPKVDSRKTDSKETSQGIRDLNWKAGLSGLSDEEASDIKSAVEGVIANLEDTSLSADPLENPNTATAKSKIKLVNKKIEPIKSKSKSEKHGDFEDFSYQLPLGILHPCLIKSLNDQQDLSASERDLFLEFLYEDFSAYTLHPTPQQYHTVVKSVFHHWPHLKSSEELNEQETMDLWITCLEEKFIKITGLCHQRTPSSQVHLIDDDEDTISFTDDVDVVNERAETDSEQDGYPVFHAKKNLSEKFKKEIPKSSVLKQQEEPADDEFLSLFDEDSDCGFLGFPNNPVDEPTCMFSPVVQNPLTMQFLAEAIAKDLGKEVVLEDFERNIVKPGLSSCFQIITRCYIKKNTYKGIISYITKMNLSRRKLFTQMVNNQLLREGYFISSVMCALNKTLTSINLKAVNFPTCVHCSTDNKIVFLYKDFREVGFQSGSDSLSTINNIYPVLEQIAKLHAASLLHSYACGQRLQEAFPNLAEEWYDPDSDMGFLYKEVLLNMLDLAGVILSEIGGHRKEQKWLMNHRSICLDIYSTDSSTDTKNLRALCHGDLKSSNVLYRYQPNGQCGEAALVNLQQCQVRSVVTDILKYFYTSMSRENRKHHVIDCLQWYYRNFKLVFDLSCAPTPFTFEELKKEYVSKVWWGVASGVLHQFTKIATDELVFDMETLTDRNLPRVFSDMSSVIKDSVKNNVELRTQFLGFFDIVRNSKL